VATQKPEVGACYKIWSDEGLELYYIMKIISVKEDCAEYIILKYCNWPQIWDYVQYPECLDNKLSLLEMELL
jgi:hypothetical protein